MPFSNIDRHPTKFKDALGNYIHTDDWVIFFWTYSGAGVQQEVFKVVGETPKCLRIVNSKVTEPGYSGENWNKNTWIPAHAIGLCRTPHNCVINNNYIPGWDAF